MIKKNKKLVSITIILAMVFSLFLTTVAFANPYTEYAKMSGLISLEDSSVKLYKGDLFRVYVSANVGHVNKQNVTAFQLLGSCTDNLEIVNSGFAGDESMLNISQDGVITSDGIPDSYKSFNKMMHNSKTTGQTIDFTAVVLKNDNQNAIIAENGMAKLIWIDFRVIGTGTMKINIDNSYVRTAFEDNMSDKFCMTDVEFSKKVSQTGGDGPTVPSGTVVGGGNSGGSTVIKKPGKINNISLVKVPSAKVEIDQENKEIDIVVPQGTDLSSVLLDVDYNGTLISIDKDKEIDLTKPIDVTVTGEDGKKVKYVVKTTYKEDSHVTPSNDNPYSDVEKDRWSYKMIDSMIKDNLLTGYGKDENGKIIIKPTGLITRQEAAKISVCAYGLTVEKDVKTSFADNDLIAEWAVPYVFAGVNHPNKMIRGYAEDNTFRPLANITREEIITMIINTFGFGADENPTLTFEDKDQLTWSAGYVSKAVALTIVKGYEDNTFRPKQYVTREEACSMFDRARTLYKSLTNN